MSLHTALISGASATGKSTSFEYLENPEGVLYLNCEAGKQIPFPAKFIKGPDGKVGFTITDPLQVPEAFRMAEQQEHIHAIVVDSLTYMMDMFESVHVIGSSNTMQGWQDYGQFFRNLMMQEVAKSTKKVFFTAHTSTIYNEADMAMTTTVPIKGSLKGNGIESYFNTVISTKKLSLKELEGYESKYLNITEDDELIGYKYVFQTRLTKDTVNERIRASKGMWSVKETYIDNNVQFVIERMDEYYG